MILSNRTLGFPCSRSLTKRNPTPARFENSGWVSPAFFLKCWTIFPMSSIEQIIYHKGYIKNIYILFLYPIGYFFIVICLIGYKLIITYFFYTRKGLNLRRRIQVKSSQSIPKKGFRRHTEGGRLGLEHVTGFHRKPPASGSL